jgi:RimJ/RimL family protein N-acetyltransferase
MTAPAPQDVPPLLIRRLHAGARGDVERFFLQELDDISLYWRFFRTMTPATVRTYVAQIPFGDQGMVFGAFLGERLVGVAELSSVPGSEMCRENRPGSLSCAELGIAVSDRMRHKGLGRMLLQRVLLQAWTKGLKRVQLSSLRDNHPMLRLAEAIGFQKLREQSGEIIMQVQRPGDWQVAVGESEEIAAAACDRKGEAAPREVVCTMRTLKGRCE